MSLGNVPRKSASKRRIAAWIAGTLSAALVVTLAVVANGFDSRETPREDPSVWVERSAGQYARVNTETAEIDTVRVAESPSGVVQTGELGVMLTQGFARANMINAALPKDIHDDGAGAAKPGAGDEGASADAAAEAETASTETEATPAAQQDQGAAAMRTPDGTQEVIADGGRVLFFTQSGESYLSLVKPADANGPASLATPRLLDPLADQKKNEDGDDDATSEQYAANAAALDAEGNIALFSSNEHAIRRYDAETKQWIGSPIQVPAEVPDEDVQLALVGNKWVLFDSATGKLWREGAKGEVTLKVAGAAQLQGSSEAHGQVLIADDNGLWSIASSGAPERIVSASGIAAQPRQVGDQLVAAWIGPGEARMWTSDGGETELTIDESVEDLSNAEPEVRSNGTRALVVERRSGMMWTVPDGTLIPIEQWTLVDPPKQETGTVVKQDVTEQEPPVAVDVSFGVRAGEPALLPVLLNDYSANRKDVLTVIPDGLGSDFDPAFGSISMLSDGQGIVVQPTPGASGSATFSYRITNGVSDSAPATVTLTVVDESINTAPQWCPVDGCQRAWPSPEVAPGGTLVLPILEGWVDPEGDPMMLAGASVVNSEDPIRALVTADGKLAVRHTDPNAAAGDSVVRVRVLDSRGAESERDLRVRVRTGAAIDFAPMASTVKIGEPTALRPLERVSGGSGAFQLVSATVQQGATTATANSGTGTIDVVASERGSSILAVTVRDTVTDQETTGIIRVTAVETRNAFAVPPLRAFVRALADSTVDVLAAVPSANSRALTVRSATVRDGQLRADVIEHSSVRVSGSTFDGMAGRIGAIDVVIAEGEQTAQGRLTVFQVDDTGADVIAVADTATVRVGSVVDIPVLDNDVAPPGDRLVLHPEIGGSGASGELAFASGSRIRYLAPTTPGVYTLTYTTYGASSPENFDVGQVRVTVLAEGSNREPQPATVTVRLAPGERVKATIPLSGVDPDGDRLRLVSVSAPDDPQLSASILPRSNAVQVEASASAQHGVQVVGYTVRDPFGGEAVGKLRIIVTEPDPAGGAPVVYSDYVRIAKGTSSPATVRPLDNDLDPSGGALQLVSVEPNVPGGEDSPAYRELASRLDLSDIKQGVVRVKGGAELGTVSYKYTVRSSKSKSTADGLIVVQVSERIGQQAPAVTDTVLAVRDRADFERSGVDVVTDRVRWAGGDVSTLKLSLWGSAESRYTVRGSSIVGAYRAEGDLVPFRLAGTDVSGNEVETFGFLIVPPLDELRLSLKQGAAAISVAENKSVDTNIANLIDLGPRDKIELDQSNFSTQRQQSSCSAIGSTSIRYTAGREAPWTDNCVVRVKLVEQHTYTLLPIPVTIIPDEPAAQLNPLTRTIAPGATETINLEDMVQWQGGREGTLSKLRWQLGGGAAAFEVSASGAQVQVVARADATPGAQEVLSVSVSGAGESQSLLTLRVGEAAVDAPKGGTVSLQCTVGSSCSTSLIGVGGEYDPFAGKAGGGLTLVSVNDGGCQFGTMQASANSVSVSWADPRGPGGRCTASFVVRDAQNRTGTGTIEFDAQGVPRAPVGVSATGAGGDSVTLSVGLSGETSHPEVTGVKLMAGGSSVGSCTLGGGQATCTVTGLTPGVRQTYYAVATNSVGDSAQSSNGVETWAYRPPAPPSVSGGEAVRWVENTDPAVGKVRINVGPSTAERRVLVIDGAEVALSSDNTYVLRADGSPRDVRVYSLDAPSMIPPAYTGGDGGKGESASLASGALPIGAPVAGEVTLALSGNKRTDWSIEAVNWSLNGGDALHYNYRIEGGGFSRDRQSGNNLPEHRTYIATVTASNNYGTAGPVMSDPQTSGVQLPMLTGSYTTNTNPSYFGAWSVEYSAGQVSFSPNPTGDVSASQVSPEHPTGTVIQCGANGLNCSPEGPISPSGPAPVRVTLNACIPWNGTDLPSHATIMQQISSVGAVDGLTLTAAADRSISLDWAGVRGQAVFSEGLCAPTP